MSPHRYSRLPTIVPLANKQGGFRRPAYNQSSIPSNDAGHWTHDLQVRCCGPRVPTSCCAVRLHQTIVPDALGLELADGHAEVLGDVVEY